MKNRNRFLDGEIMMDNKIGEGRESLSPFNIYYKSLLLKLSMYRPKSPTASSKPMNFSPSPQSRRKINNTKTHI